MGKNLNYTMTKVEYIIEGQPSPLKLTFGVELGLNLHFKNLK